jgi:four helix bundle protein
MENFRKLIIWKRTVELATNVYKVTVNFPKYELYGLTSQIRKSAVSISSNIAEGAGRRTKKDFAKFLSISYGSACELETQLLIARNLEYLKVQDFESLYQELDEIQKILFTLENKQHGLKET